MATHATPCRTATDSAGAYCFRTTLQISLRAFTLIEMLVVITIIAILSAITIGTFFKPQRLNKLLATEHLIADFVRQAKHAARSSGAPVIVKLTPVDRSDSTHGWQVSGVSRVPLATRTWDGADANGTTYAIDAIEPRRITVGLSGNGRTGIDESHPETITLDREQQIVRGSRKDGFYIACAVKPMAVTAAATPIPLLLVGDANDNLTSSLAGLMLMPVHRALASSIPGGNGKPMIHAYELIGWVHPYDGSGSPPANEVSSLTSTPADVTREVKKFASGDEDIAGPIVGDRWEEFGLLCDGEHLTLYRNGQRVGEVSANADLPPGKDRIHVGKTTVPGTSGTLYAGDAAVFDDVRLYRLGTDQMGQMPGGVIPETAFRMKQTVQIPANDDERNGGIDIVAHPDGRVEFRRQGPPVLIARRALAKTTSYLGGSPVTSTLITADKKSETVYLEGGNHLVFSLNPRGSAERERGPLNAVVVTINGSGVVASSLATIEHNAASGVDYPVLDQP